MAWTAPRTWTDGELVTASIMNTHVRDDLSSTMHLIAFKSADEIVNNSSVLQNDNHLIVPVGASETWALTWYLRHVNTTSGTPDLQVAWTFPAGNLVAYTVNTVAAVLTHIFIDGTSSPTTAQRIDSLTVSAAGTLAVFNMQVTSGSAGNVTLQWAQFSAGVSDTTMKAGSSVWGAKVA